MDGQPVFVAWGLWWWFLTLGFLVGSVVLVAWKRARDVSREQITPVEGLPGTGPRQPAVRPGTGPQWPGSAAR